MRLYDLVNNYKPETHGNTRGHGWFSHLDWLQQHEADAMIDLLYDLAHATGWIGPPVPIHDGIVQDGHKRICSGIHLRLWDLEVPTEEVTDE